MSWWVITANGTASGPMPEEKAWSERERLIRKGGEAASIAVVKADSKEKALEFKPPMI